MVKYTINVYDLTLKGVPNTRDAFFVGINNEKKIPDLSELTRTEIRHPGME